MKTTNLSQKKGAQQMYISGVVEWEILVNRTP